MCIPYRDSAKSMWFGPYQVIHNNSKTVSVITGGRASVFSIKKFKKYIPPSSEKNALLLAGVNKQKAARNPTYRDDPNYGIYDSYCNLQDNNERINHNPFETHVKRLLKPSYQRVQGQTLMPIGEIKSTNLVSAIYRWLKLKLTSLQTPTR